jgi:hypothetical protein
MVEKNMLVTAVFRDRLDAEQAFDYLYGLGYRDNDIHVLMSDKSHSTFTAARKENEPRHEASSHAAEGAGVGGAIGTVVGAAAAGIAAIGTSLAIPGLGLVVAGPLAAALAGAGAGAVTGGVVGALVGLGVPEQNAEAYHEALRNGGIVVGVWPRTTDDIPRIKDKFHELHGENVCYC